MGPGLCQAFAGTTWNLRLQNRGAGGGTAFQIDMRPRRILQRVGGVDRHMQFAVDDGGEQRVGAFQ